MRMQARWKVILTTTHVLQLADGVAFVLEAGGTASSRGVGSHFYIMRIEVRERVEGRFHRRCR